MGAGSESIKSSRVTSSAMIELNALTQRFNGKCVQQVGTAGNDDTFSEAKCDHAVRINNEQRVKVIKTTRTTTTSRAGKTTTKTI